MDFTDLTSIMMVVASWLNVAWWVLMNPQEWLNSGFRAYAWVETQTRQHGQILVTLASLTFGLWKWYRSRESELYRRLGRAIEREELHLRDARNGLATVLTRPGGALPIKAPLFAARPLSQVLLRTRWRSALAARWLPTRTDRSLKKAIEKLQEVESNAARRLEFVSQQLATAHVILGALDSGRAGVAADTARQIRLNDQARGHFQDAQRVRGMDDDAELIFMIGHQLLKTNNIAQAMSSFEKLEEFAESESDARLSAILRLRARVGQALCRVELQQDTPANNLLVTVCDELPNHAPLRGRLLLEKAEMHELHAAIRRRLGFANVAAESIRDARNDYATVVDQVEKRSRNLTSYFYTRVLALIFRRRAQAWVGDRQRQMRTAAEAGKTRLALIDKVAVTSSP